MTSRAVDIIRKVTRELNDEILREQLATDRGVTYRPVPYATAGGRASSAWRICLALVYDSSIRIGLDVYDEVVLGRGQDAADYVGLLSQEEAEQLGVSRRHAMLRPTESRLYVVDLGSTNGTWLNGHPVGVNMPYTLSDGDLVTFGRMEFVLTIIKSPTAQLKPPDTQADLSDALPSIARSITSPLDREEVVRQSVGRVASYTGADEVGIWLVHDKTGELFLEAGHGSSGGQMLRLPVKDTTVGEVLETGEAVYLNREYHAAQVQTEMIAPVETAFFAPVMLGGVPFGVLGVARSKPASRFSERDQKFIAAIADFTAIAIQNANRYDAAAGALARRSQAVATLNYAMAYDVKSLLNSMLGHAGLLQSHDALDQEAIETAGQIIAAGNNLLQVVDQLIEIAALHEDQFVHHSPCDLVEIVTRAVDNLHQAATARSIGVEFQLVGDPYLIQGNATYLYRSMCNLIDNGVKFSLDGTRVWVTLVFWPNEVAIRVLDSGPGIPEEELPTLFDRYFRTKPLANGKTGIGLGLQLVQTVVSAHRGWVIARNAEGGGAELLITLPTNWRSADIGDTLMRGPDAARRRSVGE